MAGHKNRQNLTDDSSLALTSRIPERMLLSFLNPHFCGEDGIFMKSFGWDIYDATKTMTVEKISKVDLPHENFHSKQLFFLSADLVK